MKRFETQASAKTHLVIALSLVGALVLDVAAPLGIAVWVFYLAPVAVSLFAWRSWVPLAVAGVATVFIAVGAVLPAPPDDFEAPVAFANRAMVLVAIWILAVVARQLIVTKVHLRAREWLRSGQRHLSERAQGEQQIDELGDNIMRFLCEYLGVPVGALYAVEPSGGLRRVADYAVGAGTSATSRERVGAGDGLLGRAIKDRRVLRFDDVPEGYMNVSSALGEAKPRHLVAVPTLVDGAANGAIELGFFNEVGRADMELLETVSEHIAVAIRSSLYRTRLEELLEARQQQAEELQTQQEELRVANEELESQSDALRESQARLEAQQAELEQTNAQIEEQSKAMETQRDELAQSQHELLRHSAELARANDYKSEFLSNMSHELRTPLNSALILAKMLADNKDGNLTPDQVKYASTIYTAGNDLLELINEILNLSRIEAGALELQPKPVEIARIVEPLAQTFEPVAAQQNLAFELEVEAGLPDSIVTDRLRLQQILRNLLANAFKFTQEGSVSLRVSPHGPNRICFAVRDTGPGIPAEQQEAVFEAFRQADGTTQRRHGGTGLGLTISRELSRRLGGEISVDSVSGEGSDFRLILPVQWEESERAEPPAARPAVPVPGAGDAVPASAADAGTTEPAATAAGAGSLAGAGTAKRADSDAPIEDDRDGWQSSKRSVLVVEDDPKFAAILRDLAREQGFQCLVTPSAGEGIRLAKKFLPSGVILDVHLPDGSGLSVLETLKRHQATRHIPIHVVSVADLAQQALELGAVGYAVKPVRREQLVDAFQRLEETVERKLRRVLVVEDVPAQRDGLVALLSSEGVEISAVGTADEALERLNKTTFDCMVLDLTLGGGKSGYELLDEMAAGESFSFPPVIVYTGRALTRDEEQYLRRYTSSIVIKGARSPERLLDEVTLFLHQVETQLPPDKQRMLRAVRDRDAVLEERSVLLAEDDARNVFALTNVLEPKGVKLDIARNGREALERLEEASSDPAAGIDLVLMDIMMPEMDGLTAIREIRRRPEWQKLPIIALTAKTMPDDREKCLQAGANDYIAKPLDVDQLVSLIKVWMPK